MKKALITGGAGFIGSHLAERLLESQWDVTVVDDLSTGRRENIAHLESQEHFRWHQASVLNRSIMEDVVDTVDVVFHLAAVVGVQLVVQQPVQAIETNIRATQLLLELCSRSGTLLLQNSSSEVYGKSSAPQLSEADDLVLGPSTQARWGYAASKMAGEYLAAAYAREKRLQVITVRLFNTIGPRQTGDYGMVVPRFIQQSLAQEPLTVYGDGAQTRGKACFFSPVKG